MEKYQNACDDLSTSFELDPTLKKDGQTNPLDEIKQLFEKIQNQFKKYKSMSTKQQTSLIEKIPTNFSNTLNTIVNKASFKDVTLGDLSVGTNSGLVVNLKIISCITVESNIPSVFAAIDKSGAECLLSVYNVQFKAIRGGDIVSIPSPTLIKTKLQDEEYNHIRIPDAQLSLFVNQKPLQKDQLVTPSMSVQTFM